jgi:NAD(P)H dehydrogenase (quinone)
MYVILKLKFKTIKKMILVTGATGHFGKTTIDFLLGKGISANDIAALVRDESKATDLKAKGIELRKGDYNDFASLVAAFKGVDKLLLVSGNDIANRLKQQENAVTAAREAGVKHIIYTSFARKNETDTSPIAFVGKSHIETEKLIKASGIPYTIMLNGLYADVLPMFFGEKVLESGIFLPAGDGKAAYTTRNDMAEAAANILLGDGHVNREYVMTNTTNYTLKEAASIVSELTGKDVSYVSPTAEVYSKTLSGAGVPMEYIGMFAGFSEAIRQGEFETSSNDLEKLIGRRPTSLKEFFKTVYN